VPVSALAGDDRTEPVVDDSWFQGPVGEDPGHWSTLPTDWHGVPEDRLLAGETLRVIGDAVSTLPPMQAEVIRLRDVQGWSSEEVRNALDLSETNQRVLLHRARSAVRRAVDRYLEEAG
jgi:RNA polymerase sigma-70 factor (ECF subfamily)